ncbi:MAG: TrkA family potassium uptake protein [Methanocellales archaeon]|nr:TrkA family potassium uptake protein [Methanocellales archaeon]
MYVVIIGCGRVGRGLAQQLSMNGNDVVVVDKEVSRFQELGPNFDGLTVEGDGTDQDVLTKAGGSKADVFAVVTDDDNTNLMACQIAKRVFKVQNVIARVNDPEKESLYKDAGIDATVCPTTIAVTHLRNSIMHPGLIALMTVNEGGIEINKVEVKGPVIGKALKDVHLPEGAIIAALVRGSKAIVPDSDTILQEGDIAVVVNLAGASGKVEDILTKG